MSWCNLLAVDSDNYTFRISAISNSRDCTNIIGRKNSYVFARIFPRVCSRTSAKGNKWDMICATISTFALVMLIKPSD
jgi:hypothetical protein